ncbi:DFP2-like protein [Euroglyphus maynei]|uniref:DFP2-like protein n=1 Tax=Euroglyphus maynei TaxID=6958 RepID=A0A1Y3BD05_EURMA|nr:DFP2-like protein [Euroglyphus maynei]
MLRFTVCLALVGMAAATAFMPSYYGNNNLYGRQFLSGGLGYYGLGGGLSLMAKPALLPNNGYLNTYPSYAFGSSYQPNLLTEQRFAQNGPILAAVNSNHKLSMYDVPSTFSANQPLNIEVPSSAPSVNFLMKSRSSNLNVETLHEGTGGSFKETVSEDQPHVNRHTVLRPIVQQVRELITPYRQVEQKINPVQEQVETIVPRGQEYQEQKFAYGQPLTTAASLQTLPLLQTQTAALQTLPLLQTQTAAALPQLYGLKQYGYGLKPYGYGLTTDFSGASYKPEDKSF